MWLYLAAPWWIVNIVKRKELRAQPLSAASSVSPRGRTGQERSPSPQIITRGDGPFNFIVAEGATPRFSTAKDQTPPLISATPSFVLMEIRPCLPATLSAEMQSWSAFPAGTTDDNDVLEELIVSFNPFFLLCVSFFSFLRSALWPLTFLPNMLDLVQRIVFCALLGSVYASCPPRCECSEAAHTVKCVSRDLRSIPTGIPGYTRNLFITGNQISRIGAESFKGLDNVTNLSLSNNR